MYTEVQKLYVLYPHPAGHKHNLSYLIHGDIVLWWPNEPSPYSNFDDTVHDSSRGLPEPCRGGI